MKQKELYEIKNYENLEYGIDKLNACLHILKCYTEEHTSVDEVQYIDLFMEDIIQEIDLLVACL